MLDSRFGRQAGGGAIDDLILSSSLFRVEITHMLTEVMLEGISICYFLGLLLAAAISNR